MQILIQEIGIKKKIILGFNFHFKQLHTMALVGNIKGPAGTNGKSSLVGNGVPAVGLGSNGDNYTDVATGNVYEKVAGSWT